MDMILKNEEGFKVAKNIDGPVIIHVITKKGKGMNLQKKIQINFMDRTF